MDSQDCSTATTHRQSSATLPEDDNSEAAKSISRTIDAVLDGISAHEAGSKKCAASPLSIGTTICDNASDHNSDQSDSEDENDDDENVENPEWEEDSSPIQSSDSSSEDDSDDELPELTPDLINQILAAADGNDDEDDEDGDGATRPRGIGAPLRTKNELPEPVPPRPDVIITPDMKIEPVGTVWSIVENTVCVMSNSSGEHQVLDIGTILCKEDRTVLAVIAEIMGPVTKPIYVMRFEPEYLKELDLSLGQTIFYSVKHAVRVFTAPLKEMRGTDASNIHDEELPEDEMEFSDDEKERQFLLAKGRKGKKRADRNFGKGDNGRFGNSSRSGNNGRVSYDDDDDDGPYRPLSRPKELTYPGGSLPPRPDTRFDSSRASYSQRGDHRDDYYDRRPRSDGRRENRDRRDQRDYRDRDYRDRDHREYREHRDNQEYYDRKDQRDRSYDRGNNHRDSGDRIVPCSIAGQPAQPVERPSAVPSAGQWHAPAAPYTGAPQQPTAGPYPYYPYAPYGSAPAQYPYPPIPQTAPAASPESQPQFPANPSQNTSAWSSQHAVPQPAAQGTYPQAFYNYAYGQPAPSQVLPAQQGQQFWPIPQNGSTSFQPGQ